MTHKELAYEIINKIHASYPKFSIAITGSIATNTWNIRSDIDLLLMNKDLANSFLINFNYKGIEVSLFFYSVEYITKKERKAIYFYNIHPYNIVYSCLIIYDYYNLIGNALQFINYIIEKRSILKRFLIHELLIQMHKEINFYLKTNDVQIYHKIIKNIIAISLLQNCPRKFISKKESSDFISFLNYIDPEISHELKWENIISHDIIMSTLLIKKIILILESRQNEE